MFNKELHLLDNSHRQQFISVLFRNFFSTTNHQKQTSKQRKQGEISHTFGSQFELFFAQYTRKSFQLIFLLAIFIQSFFENHLPGEVIRRILVQFT